MGVIDLNESLQATNGCSLAPSAAFASSACLAQAEHYVLLESF